MVLYGAGGHAKVVYDALASQGIKPCGIFDDDISLTSFMDIDITNPYSPNQFYGEKIILSIGSNKIRRRLSDAVSHEFGLAIHKSAFVGDGVVIGNGSMIMVRATAQVGVRIGGHTIINTGVIIEHDCKIGDFAHVGPGSVLCGDVRVGDGAFIGANTTILPGITIGDWAVIGAGSVVTKNVNEGARLTGNPAKEIE